MPDVKSNVFGDGLETEPTTHAQIGHFEFSPDATQNHLLPFLFALEALEKLSLILKYENLWQLPALKAQITDCIGIKNDIKSATVISLLRMHSLTEAIESQKISNIQTAVGLYSVMSEFFSSLKKIHELNIDSNASSLYILSSLIENDLRSSTQMNDTQIENKLNYGFSILKPKLEDFVEKNADRTISTISTDKFLGEFKFNVDDNSLLRSVVEVYKKLFAANISNDKNEISEVKTLIQDNFGLEHTIEFASVCALIRAYSIIDTIENGKAPSTIHIKIGILATINQLISNSKDHLSGDDTNAIVKLCSEKFLKLEDDFRNSLGHSKIDTDASDPTPVELGDNIDSSDLHG
ncbi:hypothetical protein Cyrtocomes_00291 [Candidatus Cyrtobacter comes]|uniref:HPt domain-containing protein n=1 Tax=Candidatus Cyrtobacter comes TaxID=675776 RepID=A0ABU5L717_9RICK|nr:hypothetical protein [Candidatus Cyrtobacter comes]MDZ5761929.1 hypothetical protein [Candidatus Cyrtobacter comes]